MLTAAKVISRLFLHLALANVHHAMLSFVPRIEIDFGADFEPKLASILFPLGISKGIKVLAWGPISAGKTSPRRAQEAACLRACQSTSPQTTADHYGTGTQPGHVPRFAILSGIGTCAIRHVASVVFELDQHP